MSFCVLEEAAHECVSEDALVHLKSYKYSSVDKSLISNYILKHYVRAAQSTTYNLETY
jgi:ethanolaminephosphotransferase